MSRGPLSPQWRWVTILCALTVVGLAAALFGEGGPMWWLSWLTIAAPLAVAARYVWGRQATCARSGETSAPAPVPDSR